MEGGNGFKEGVVTSKITGRVGSMLMCSCGCHGWINADAFLH